MRITERSKSLKFSGITGAVIFAVFLIPFTLPAEEKPEDVYLDQITVIAPQPGVEINTDKTVIKADEFKKPGEVRTLTDVLTEIGGVDVQRISPLISSPGDEVSIRGLNGGMEYTASVSVSNLTGTSYEEQSGYEMPKHVWGIQIGAEF